MKKIIIIKNNMKEIWKDITNYEGMYQVSSRGRVKSLKRKGCTQDKILNPSPDSGGYLQVILYKYKKRKAMLVHQLVAMAFLGHTPCGMKIVVDHIDEVKTNNNLSNFRVTTQRGNLSRLGGSSKYVGVNWYEPNGKWVAKIYINDKQKHLGYFDEEVEASEAYQEALKNLNN